MKKLGFGLMRLPTRDRNRQGDIDTEQLCRMVDLFLEKGFTYFDTALMYNAGQSERMVRKTLVERHPRESFTVATKLHSGFFQTLEDRDRILGEQLEKTGAGYFDYYLLHGIDGSSVTKYERLDCFRWLEEKKAAGRMKHIGFSFHGTPELLDRLLTDYPSMEFVQLQLNYLDWESPWIQAGACYAVAEKHGVPVVVMEPVKGGTLSRVPAEAEALLKARAPELSVVSWGIRFAASLPNVMMVLSGMSTLEQVEDNVSYMSDFRPLTEEDRAVLRQVADIINAQTAVPCTGCSYCTEGCPMHIAIPQYFSLYNEDMRERLEEKGWTVNFSNYRHLTASFGKASECVACGQCEEVCPQHLPIIELMKTVAKHYEH